MSVIQNFEGIKPLGILGIILAGFCDIDDEPLCSKQRFSTAV
jgi:hypothetical protein